MREFFHNMKLSFLLAAVLYIILGLILLIWPGVSATRVCYAFGILLIYGVVTIVSFFPSTAGRAASCSSLPRYRRCGPWACSCSARSSWPPSPVIHGLFIVVDGLVGLKRALELRRMLYLPLGPCPWCFPPYRRYWGW